MKAWAGKSVMYYTVFVCNQLDVPAADITEFDSTSGGLDASKTSHLC